MPNNRIPINNQRSMGNPSLGQAPSNPNPKRLAIALGDPAGIGAEVTLKAIAQGQWGDSPPLLVGCRRWLEASYQGLKGRSATPLTDPASLEMVDQPLSEAVQPGQSNAACGDGSFQWLTAAVELVQAGRCHSLVTAPIAKSSWHAASHNYPCLLYTSPSPRDS